MELKDFIGKFVSQFEEEDPAIFEADLDSVSYTHLTLPTT